MRNNTARRMAPLFIVLISSVFVFIQAKSVVAQDSQQPAAPSPAVDPIEQLRLMPEQRQRIRSIREETKQERAAIGQRLREANFALQQALDADVLDDALIEQRLREAAAAQTAQMRMRIATEIKIRRVLTQEQLATLRVLRLQVQGLMRDGNRDQRPARDGLRPNQRNGVGPLFPRQNIPPRTRRP